MSTPQGTPCACGSSAACAAVGDASSTLCSACSRRERRRAAIDAERERLTAAVAEHVSSGGDPWSFRLGLTLPATVASEATVAPSSNSVGADGGRAVDHVSAASGAEGDGVELHRCVVCAVGESGDAERLATFGRCGLSAASRSSFGPYMWDSDTLIEQLEAAVAKSVATQDLHLIAIDESTGDVGGYAFLWSAQERVPELGLAVADKWHGRGLGTTLLLLLEAMARSTGRVAIELTTMQGNDAAYRTYLNAGYVYLGIIRNPVGVDVTAAFRGEVVATSFCDERSMVRIITTDEEEERLVLEEMAVKRQRAAEIFGAPTM